MNRKIIFRGKDHYTGEWIEGYLIERNKKSWIVAYSLDKDPIGIINNHWFVNTPSAVVDQKTVGQYTGLKDKNGVKIFEGDRNDDGDFVVFCESCNGWEFGAIDIPSGDIFIKCHKCDGNFFFEDVISDFVVVGNIYENESN